MGVGAPPAVLQTQAAVDGAPGPTGDGRTLHVHDLLTDTAETIDLDPDGDASAADGHGGAGAALIEAVATGDRSLVTSGCCATATTRPHCCGRRSLRRFVNRDALRRSAGQR